MSNDFKVKDINLAEFGRKEISIAESEMPGLMALREKFKKDKHSSVGLLKAVNKRKKLLDYLKRNKLESYKGVISKLNIRK